MKKILYFIIYSVFIIISCDSTTEPAKISKIYGTIVDKNGNPVADAEVCIIPDIPSGKIIGIIDLNKNSDIPELQVVELQNFMAEKKDEFALLKWTTLSEANSDYFELLRADEKDFKPGIYEIIATVKAKGNSVTTQLYSVIDSSVQKNLTYLYKLNIVDRDKSMRESNNIRFVNEEEKYELFTNSPNPFYYMTMISYTLAKPGFIDINISEKCTGTEYLKLNQLEQKAGNYSFYWQPFLYPNDEDSIVLRPGVYTVKIATVDTTMTLDMILNFKFKETDCKIPLHVIKTDKNGKFEIDWKWFQEFSHFFRIAENGQVLGQFSYGESGEIIARKLLSETNMSKKYLLGRQSLTIDKSNAINIKLIMKEVNVPK